LSRYLYNNNNLIRYKNEKFLQNVIRIHSWDVDSKSAGFYNIAVDGGGDRQR
jgi:hypothetical protein